MMHDMTTTSEATPFPLFSSGILELRLKTALVLGLTPSVFIITMTERNAFYISSSIYYIYFLNLFFATERRN